MKLWEKNKLFFIGIIFPVILVFDFVQYLFYRSSCFQCHNLTEFFKTSSLSIFLLAQGLKSFKK